MSLADLELLSADDVIWLFRYRQLFIMVPLQSPGAEHMATTTKFMEDTSQRGGGAFACCVLVLPGVESPTPEARERIRKATDSFQGRLKCHCLLVHAQGFVASTAISVGGFMMRLRGGQMPSSLCKDSNGAASFLCAKFGTSLGTAHEVQSALDDVRQQVEARPPASAAS